MELAAIVFVIASANHIAAKGAETSADESAFHRVATLMADNATCSSTADSANRGAGPCVWSIGA